ncbi:IS110 family transposase [Streptomyces sp. NPDC088745]|uniref:IS110 family transposase n=1 Tax=Streptomyces sp. NPDC088745 TaxID=3365884 RepID=UPI0037FF5567
MDTHRDYHVAAVLSMTGRTLGIERFPATASGYRQLHAWAVQWGAIRGAGVESSGNYGAALSRYLLSQSTPVLEAPGPGRAARRRQSKSDRGDAELAARAVLSGRARSPVKSGTGAAEIARLYLVVKDSAVKAQRQAVNQLKAILVTADPALREELAGLSRRALVSACLALNEGDDRTDPVVRATRFTLRVLAERNEQLRAQALMLERRLSDLIRSHYPQLVDAVGIGPHSAAVLLTAMGDNADRLRGEASFAALCGASPVEYSSGNRQHRRLNRGGNRQANAALYRIVMTRLRWDPRTQAYYERRLTEGKTRRETIRCLKRYVAREVYRLVHGGHRSDRCGTHHDELTTARPPSS